MFVDHMCRHYKISINKLAKIGGVAPSTVATWKRDSRSIGDVPYKVIKKWAKEFKTQPQWLAAMFN